MKVMHKDFIVIWPLYEEKNICVKTHWLTFSELQIKISLPYHIGKIDKQKESKKPFYVTLSVFLINRE